MIFIVIVSPDTQAKTALSVRKITFMVNYLQSSQLVFPHVVEGGSCGWGRWGTETRYLVTFTGLSKQLIIHNEVA